MKEVNLIDDAARGGVAFDCHGWLVPLDGRLEFGKGPERVTAGCRLQRSHRGRKEPVWKAQSSGLKNCTRVQGRWLVSA